MIKQELIKRALAEISKRYENYEYFFSKLESPDWIEPLYKEGRFMEPPPSISDGKYIRFPYWPESQYLARVAQKAPELVLKIALAIPNTNNVRIHEDLINVALAIPPELSVQLLSRVKDWIESPYSLLLPEKVGKLVVHLTNGGKIDEAIGLANTLMDILPDPQWEEKSKSESSFLTIEPHAHFYVWDYEQILINDMPILVKVAEEKALSLLGEKLDKVVRFSIRKSEQEKPDDHLYVWRDSIESDHNLYEGLRDLLITAVRKAGESLIETKGKIILNIIEQYKYYIFKRIGLYLRRKYPTVDIEGTNKLVTDPNVFDVTALHHEYFHLLKERFNELSPDAKDGYLALVEKGEDITWWISMRERTDGKKPNQEEINQRNRYWQYTKLIPIQEYLTGDWRKKFDELKKEFPEPEHPDYHFYSGGGVRIGPTSPKSQQELSTMSNDELIEFLTSWKAKDDWDEPEPEGLSRELTQVVKSNPARYALIANKFISLDPTYISGLIQGFREAARDKKIFEWQFVLEFCDWVVKQPREIPERPKSRFLHSDPDWSWSRKTIASLFSTSLNLDYNEIPFIPFKYRKIVWKILEPLTDDIDPTTERDKEPSMDPFTSAINTVRGEAMNATMEYALWVRRNITKEPDGKSRVDKGFNEMPEVREILVKHLDINQDSSLAVRSVYGRWFPWLVLLDSQWAKDSVDKIFPKENDKVNLYNAAWNTYIIFCSAYDNAFDLLKEEYKYAIERIGTVKKTPQMLKDVDNRLAEHLMVFYWKGIVHYDETNGLLDLFYTKAPEKLLAHTIWYIGNVLYSAKETIQPDILNRLKNFWEWRNKDTKRPISNAERREFGLWFASAKFDDEWAMNQLKDVLNKISHIDSSHRVSEHIVKIANKMPLDTIECLYAVVKNAKDNFELYGWLKNARNIISTILSSTNEKAKQLADETIHLLVAKGYLEYRDL